MKPRVFIGSSTEGLEVARAIQLNLDHEAEVVVWTDGVFSLSQTAFESLARTLDTVDFGIFVLSADDSVVTRGSTHLVPRDNVIFELGLFAGHLGIDRTFLLHCREKKPFKLPSDLLGITTATFEKHVNGNLQSSLGAACSLIRNSIRVIDCNSPSASWDELCAWIADLASQLRRSPRFGGFPVDLLIGISRGGVIVADLLARKFGEAVPSVNLWADRRSRYPDACFTPPENWLSSYIVPIVQDKRVRNILLVDDIASSGQTIRSAREFIQGQIADLPDKNLKTAVLVATAEAQDAVEFFVQECSFDEFSMPYTVLD